MSRVLTARGSAEFGGRCEFRTDCSFVRRRARRLSLAQKSRFSPALRAAPACTRAYWSRNRPPRVQPPKPRARVLRGPCCQGDLGRLPARPVVGRGREGRPLVSVRWQSVPRMGASPEGMSRSGQCASGNASSNAGCQRHDHPLDACDPNRTSLVIARNRLRWLAPAAIEQGCCGGNARPLTCPPS